jgi:hypothetical protein
MPEEIKRQRRIVKPMGLAFGKAIAVVIDLHLHHRLGGGALRQTAAGHDVFDHLPDFRFRETAQIGKARLQMNALRHVVPAAEIGHHQRRPRGAVAGGSNGGRGNSRCNSNRKSPDVWIKPENGGAHSPASERAGMTSGSLRLRCKAFRLHPPAVIQALTLSCTTEIFLPPDFDLTHDGFRQKWMRLAPGGRKPHREPRSEPPCPRVQSFERCEAGVEFPADGAKCMQPPPGRPSVNLRKLRWKNPYTYGWPVRGQGAYLSRCQTARAV